ncbi:MAG TPA: MoaD/ThiS family protein [Terrimicrobiaceae bacterium]
MSELRVLFFSSARKATGCAETKIACESHGIGESTLWERLLADFPGLEPLRSSVRLARNFEYITAGQYFYPEDEAAVIPPVSGG